MLKGYSFKGIFIYKPLLWAGPKRKFTKLWDSPYQVLEKFNNLNYEIAIKKETQIYHVNCMKFTLTFDIYICLKFTFDIYHVKFSVDIKTTRAKKIKFSLVDVYKHDKMTPTCSGHDNMFQ